MRQLIPGETVVPAKVAHRLEMHSPNPGQPIHGIFDDGADLVDIDTGHQGRHQDHPQFVFPAMGHGAFFLAGQRPPPEFP